MSGPGPSSRSSPAALSQPAASDAILRLLDRPLSAADLAAGAAFAARPPEARIVRTTRLLLFRIGDESAALPAAALRRVTPIARTVPIPHRSSGVLRGLSNIRGELVLCADLRRLLGLPASSAAPPAASSDQRRMVVIGPADNSWVFEVDALIGVESVDPAAIRPPPVTVEYSLGAFTTGVTEIDSRPVTVLDPERILAGFKAALS